MRNEPLNRLLVKPFESMFFEVPPSFERKFLPAYFDAARQLIGNDFAGYDKECRVIIQSLLESHGNQLTWDMVYADPRTASLTRRTIGALAGRTHGARGEARWQQLMIKPAADGALPTKEQVAAVRELLLTFFAKSSAAAE